MSGGKRRLLWAIRCRKQPEASIQPCRIPTPLQEWWKFAWYLIAKYGRQVVTYNDACLERGCPTIREAREDEEE